MSSVWQDMVFADAAIRGTPPSQSATEGQIAELKEALKKALEEPKELRAYIAGKDALITALRVALFQANPNDPLVNPYEPGKNALRNRIVDETKKRVLAGQPLRPYEQPPAAPSNHAQYVEELRAKCERLEGELKANQRMLVQSVACAAGVVEVTNTLVAALAKENSDNPLVNPFANEDNMVREQIFQKARQKMLVKLGAQPSPGG